MDEDKVMNVINYDGEECMLIIHINDIDYISTEPITMRKGKFRKEDIDNLEFEEL